MIPNLCFFPFPVGEGWFGDVNTMSVNQQAHTGPPFGQPQSGYLGYSQPGYGGQQIPGTPSSQYGAYNGPMTGYQQTGPPQG